MGTPKNTTHDPTRTVTLHNTPALPDHDFTARRNDSRVRIPNGTHQHKIVARSSAWTILLRGVITDEPVRTILIAEKP
jgi:hypothetical protein